MRQGSKLKIVVMASGFLFALVFWCGVSRVNPTRTAILTVRFTEPGEVIFYCPLKGHRRRGQEGIAIVTSTQGSEGKGS